MKWRIVFLLILLSQSVIIMGSPDPRHFDIRVANFADLRRTNSMIEFHDSNIFGYNSVEAYWKDETVYVSARNTVLKLNYRTGLTRNDSVTFEPQKSSVESCLRKGNLKNHCIYNYIKIMLLFNATKHSPLDSLFICGTMAEVPECWERSTRNISKSISWYNGNYRCPYNPSSSVTTIMASDGALYLGSVTGPARRDFAIFRRNQGRSKVKKPELFTKHNDQRYLLDPTFVSSHEVGDYIYFFFQEISYEMKTSCARQSIVKISRVARVCKNDTGNVHSYRQKSLWTSFLKARIVCQPPPDSDFRSNRYSSQGEYPYDLITSTFIDWSEKTLYATFTSSRSGAPGSVICRYRLNDLEKVFSSDYFSQSPRNIRHWIRKPNRGTVGCPKKGESREDKVKRGYDSNTHHLVNSDYKPQDGFAILVQNGERWTKVVKTVVRTPRKAYTVLFVATDIGRIHKIIKIKAKFCIIEILQLEQKSPVSDITLANVHKTKRSYLIASTPKRVVRLDLYRCERWHTRDLCLKAQDPYCGWDGGRLRCAPMEKRRPGRPEYEQDLVGCPDTNRPLDGEWSPWGHWKDCDQHNASPSKKCLCRHRKCDNPPAVNGGRSCVGNNIEVTNCTVDGGWTSWTSWSACDHTCGKSTRWRFRTCENPKPKFNGKRCAGPVRDEKDCVNSPCPRMKPAPIHGNWATWGSWSPCTQKCNTGFRNRSRICSSPVPQNGGHPCFGNSWEYSKCNTMECKTIEKYSLWTPWIRNWGRPVTMMKRFRFQCISAVPELTMLKTRMHSEHRRCEPTDKCRTYTQPTIAEKGKDESKGIVSLTPNENGIKVQGPDADGGWSQWGPWTACTQTCGNGGRQVRTRKCNQPPPSGMGKNCEEEAEQTRSCQNGPCPNGQWTCWSDWSECPCGEKSRVRDRKCLTVEGYQSLSCPGKSQQYEMCNNAKCTSELWESWSEWSICRGGRRLRSRSCQQADPALQKFNCPGPASEESACFTQGRSINTEEALTFNIYHLVFVGIITYLLGCASIALIYFCCYKPAGGCKGRRHRDEVSSRAGPGPGSGSNHPGYIRGTSVNGPAGTYLENASLLSSPWELPPRRGPSALDRHHSFHGTGGATTLGRQYSNASSSGVYTHASTSVRGGRLDNYDRWMLPTDSEALAYTTFRRPPSHIARAVPDDGVPGDQWEMFATRMRTRSQGEPTSNTPMLVNPPHRLERRDSEHDSVFTNSRLDGAESRQLLHSPYSVDS